MNIILDNSIVPYGIDIRPKGKIITSDNAVHLP